MASNATNDPERDLTPANYTKAQNMAAYDRLPKAVRKALQDSDNNWSAASVLYGARKHRLKAARVVELVHLRDQQARTIHV